MRDSELRKLRELVEHEREHTNLDFKREQYGKESKKDLVLDVLAMANAHTEEPRRIIFGVKKKHDGEAELVGITGTVRDSAEIQQTIHENITPDLDVEYEPFQSECGVQLAVLTIPAAPARPYQLKKGLQPRPAGFMHIRKGSKAGPCWRDDLHRMFEVDGRPRSQDMTVNWEGEGEAFEIQALPKSYKRPSQQFKDQVWAELAKRQEPGYEESDTMRAIRNTQLSELLGHRNVQVMTTEELLRGYGSAEQELQTDDIHDIFEVNGKKVGVTLDWKGSVFLEQVLVEMSLPAEAPLVIASSTPVTPTGRGSIVDEMSRSSVSMSLYPSVRRRGREILVTSSPGDVRHGVPTSVFEEPLRVVGSPGADGQDVPVKIRVHAANLPQAIERTLTLRIVANRGDAGEGQT